MTQVKCAQRAGKTPALRAHASTRTLAQRRADFEAQMRAMALADLDQVAGRLKLLHARLNRKEGREVTLLEIALAAKVAPRTFQTWVGAKNENADGTGYEKLARFYRRKLGDKTITKGWIVFGQEEEPPEQEPEQEADLMGTLNEAELLQQIFQLLAQLGATVDGLVGEVQEAEAAASRVRRSVGRATTPALLTATNATLRTCASSGLIPAPSPLGFPKSYQRFLSGALVPPLDCRK